MTTPTREEPPMPDATKDTLLDDCEDAARWLLAHGRAQSADAVTALVARVRDAEAKLRLIEVAMCEDCPARVPLVWTDAKPTVPGTYLRRDRGEKHPERWELVIAVPDARNGSVVRQTYCERGWIRSWPFPDGQFAGPIPPPADTREGEGK